MNGTTAVHLSPMTATESAGDITERLAAWIGAKGIKGHYPTPTLAALVVAEVHPSYLTLCLDQGGTPYLRDMCTRIKRTSDLTDAEFAAEMRGPRRAADMRGAA